MDGVDFVVVGFEPSFQKRYGGKRSKDVVSMYKSVYTGKDILECTH